MHIIRQDIMYIGEKQDNQQGSYVTSVTYIARRGKIKLASLGWWNLCIRMSVWQRAIMR